MILNVNDATAIVLMVLLLLIAIGLSLIIYISIKKEKERYKEEKSISIDGLITKSAINSQINSYISRIAKDSNFSLLLLEIQEYKDIQAAFGNNEAERALERAILKVIQALPHRVQIASYGETKFLIFLKSEYDRFAAIDLAKKLINLINKPIKIYRETNVNFISNIGICFYPNHGHKLKHLINSSEIALHNSINSGENKYIIYSDSLKNKFSENIEYHFEIKEAIEKKEFILKYQPIINTVTNELYGIEAYVRWDHPKHGILSPVQFLNIMEQSGDITWIGIWGLETIIKESYELNRLFTNPNLTITLNISPRQLMDTKIVDEFGKLVRKYKMNTSKIYLEVDEYSMYESNPVIKNNLSRLKRLGFKITINGFELDYSALASLETMPIDCIRLDRQFFEKEKESLIKGKLTSLIVECALATEKVIIAEEIETPKMLEIVQQLGIKYVQGYIYSKPLSSTDLHNFIREKKWLQGEITPEKIEVKEEIKKEEKKEIKKVTKEEKKEAVVNNIEKEVVIEKKEKEPKKIVEVSEFDSLFVDEIDF